MTFRPGLPPNKNWTVVSAPFSCDLPDGFQARVRQSSSFFPVFLSPDDRWNPPPCLAMPRLASVRDDATSYEAICGCFFHRPRTLSSSLLLCFFSACSVPFGGTRLSPREFSTSGIFPLDRLPVVVSDLTFFFFPSHRNLPNFCHTFLSGVTAPTSLGWPGYCLRSLLTKVQFSSLVHLLFFFGSRMSPALHGALIPLSALFPLMEPDPDLPSFPFLSWVQARASASSGAPPHNVRNRLILDDFRGLDLAFLTVYPHPSPKHLAPVPTRPVRPSRLASVASRADVPLVSSSLTLHQAAIRLPRAFFVPPFSS